MTADIIAGTRTRRIIVIAATAAAALTLSATAGTAPAAAERNDYAASPSSEAALDAAGFTVDEFTERATALDMPDELIEAALEDPEQQRYVAVHADTTHERVTTDAPLATQSSCTSEINTLNYYNSLGQVLAWFRVTKNWCYTGTTVTSSNSTQTGDVATWALPWSYNGVQDSWNYASGTFAQVGGAQGQFSVCFTLCGERNPTVEIVGYGDGTFTRYAVG